MEVLATWGADTDGAGAIPASFATDGQTYIVTNRAAATIAAAWSVSGAGAKIVVGNGLLATNFTIPAAAAYSGTVDVAAGATLTLINASIPTLGSLAATSTVDFASSAATNIPAATYGNLIHTGAGLANMPVGGNMTIAGNLTQNSNATLTLSGNIEVYGAITQIGTVGGLYWGNSGITITLGGDLSLALNASNSVPPPDANPVNSTFIFNGSSVQTIKYTAALSRANFTINSGSSVKLGANLYMAPVPATQPATTFLVNGTLDLGYYNITGYNPNAPVTNPPTALPNYPPSIFTLSAGATLITPNGAGIIGSIPSKALTCTFSSAANYEFQGAATGTFTTTPTAATVNNLTINRLSGNVTNSQPLTVNGVLALKSGIFDVTATNTLSLPADGSITGASSTRFINGPLSRAMPAYVSNSPTLYDFPVGSGSSYLPCSITLVNTDQYIASPRLEVTAFASNAGGTADGTTVASISQTEYWKITGYGGFKSGSLSLSRQQGAEEVYNGIAKGASTTTAASPYSSLYGTLSGNSIVGSAQTVVVPAGTPQYYVLAKLGNILTASSGANGSIETAGSVFLPLGSSKTYSIVPNSCFAISRVFVDGVNDAAAVSSGSLTFTNITAPHSIAVEFVAIGNCCSANAGTTIRN